jgi:hypothetical protein
MKQSPSWEAYSHSASQEIFHLLWSLKVHYRVHNSPSLLLVLSRMNPVHTLPPNFPKIYCNIIFPSTRRSFKWSLSSGFSNQNICFLYLPCVLLVMPILHRPWFDQCTSYEAPHYAVFSNLQPIILLRTLFSDTRNLCSSRSVRNQVSHPYKRTGKVMVFV